MPRMKDIREKILKELDEKPGERFSVSAIAQAVGSNNGATNSALVKLFKAGLVARPQKGVYTGKGRPPEKTEAPKPAQAKKLAAAKSPKPTPAPVESTPAPEASFSVITIDLLVEGEPSKIDSSGLLGKVRENQAVLDARVSKVTEADQRKLQVRISFADEK
jgi:hypothetical protein